MEIYFLEALPGLQIENIIKRPSLISVVKRIDKDAENVEVTHCFLPLCSAAAVDSDFIEAPMNTP